MTGDKQPSSSDLQSFGGNEHQLAAATAHIAMLTEGHMKGAHDTLHHSFLDQGVKKVVFEGSPTYSAWQ